eukprot:PhM_4_TR4259/c0_g1_i1/m.64285
MATKLTAQSWYAPTLRNASMYRLSKPTVVGPRPMLFLNGVSGVAIGHGLAAAMTNRNGMIGVDLARDESTKALLGLPEQAEQVVRFLDAHHVAWTHFVCHSYGALLGAYMSWSHPDRVGSLVLLDSPISTRAMQNNAVLRRALAAAVRDPNISADRFEQEKKKLDASEGTKGDLAVADAADTEEIERLLVGVTSEGCLARDSTAYLSPEQLGLIRHPTLLVTPGEVSVMDKNSQTLHKQIMSIRKHVAVKGAKSHADLFGANAGDVAVALDQWCDRFDVGVQIAKRWQQIRDDGLKEGASGADGAGSGGASEEKSDDKPKKKKEKKNKKK